MYCSHCGEKLFDTTQKFCQNCGAEVLTTSKITNYKSERIQRAPAPKIQYVPVTQPLKLQRGPPGKYSKLCLKQALISIFIGLLSLIIGFNYFRFLYWPHYNYIISLMVSLAILLSRIGGLILGVFSKVNSSDAQNFEPFNDTEKAGSIFAIFGMIINAIGLFLSLLGPYSIFRPPIIPIELY
ncbi:MAG: zinc ribbon domain-containing protein [Candidatus Lokiarchaeia archaeon]|nr:zinc ribbon domain-containing protein [Candidatus Lokiarchaeia archaeon]